MKLKALTIVAALLAAPVAAATAAHADTLAFTFAGKTSAKDYGSFDLSNAPKVTGVTPFSFDIDNVVGTLNGGAYTYDLTFYVPSLGGGFNFPAADFSGAQIYGGTTANPTFATGTFTLANPLQGGNETLTISSVSAAPEPAAWMLMIAGVGVAGYALRRKPQVAGSLAA